MEVCDQTEDMLQLRRQGTCIHVNMKWILEAVEMKDVRSRCKDVRNWK